jgi:4-alpha-glucanotransferase
MTEISGDPGRLAEALGIAPGYIDAWGEPRRVPEATILALAAAMGFDHADAVVARNWTKLAPPVVVVDAGDPVSLAITVPAAPSGMLDWQFVTEEGEASEGRVDIGDLAVEVQHDGRVRRRLTLLVTPPMGYHRLTVVSAGEVGETRLIVAPQRCFMPDDFAGDDFGVASLGAEGRVWGLAVQLYALKSQHNWGMGDFSDLKELAVGSAPKGARAIGLNPLHALFPIEPRHISPYSPSSRRFLNPLYLDVEAIPDFSECQAIQDLVASPAFQARLMMARASNLVDHVAVAAAKAEAFELAWRSFHTKHLQCLSARGEAFLRFQAENGAPLAEFSIFEALHERFRADSFAWRDWPLPYRNPLSAEVASFAEQHKDRIEYFQYLQWEADRQLGDAAYLAEAAGMTVGLYRDLAVGVDPSGAEAWGDQSQLLNGATIGAPPDLLNRNGQNWGLAAIDPMALQARGYAPFIAALRANMRHAGAIRVDHAMSLRHLFIIPAGGNPADGAYISYPFRDLLRITALESHRNRCAVVGEDLGTVPAGFRETMTEASILSYRLLVFERQSDGSFLPPEAYPPLATAAVGTHDVATLKGFWLGRDLDWRQCLSLYPDEDAGHADRDGRVRERRLLLDALVQQGVLPPDLVNELLPANEAPVFRYELVEAVHRYLGQSPARLMLVQLEDALGETEMVNLPGTVNEHPNWRRKLSLSVAELLDDECFKRLTKALNAVRPPRQRERAGG